MQIVGFSFSKGTYEGYDYDNVIMHCVGAGKDSDIGSVTMTVKIKSIDFFDVFIDFIESYEEKVPSDLEIMRDLIGCTCRVLYDKRGKYAADIRIKRKPDSPEVPFERG